MALCINAINNSNKKTKSQNKFKIDSKILISNLEILNINSERKYHYKNSFSINLTYLPFRSMGRIDI